MNMLQHTRVFTLIDATREAVEDRADALTEALIDLEDGHPELLDSTVFADLGEGTVGVTVTVGHETEYADAVKSADALLIEAIETIGDYVKDRANLPKVPTVPRVALTDSSSGTRSLAVA